MAKSILTERLLKFDEFLIEREIRANESLILEGGAAGHMMHPFDDHSLTFADLKKIVISALQGELNFEEEPTEKTDGQNLFVTFKDGKALFARNKGQLMAPIDVKGIVDMFKDHPSEGVRKTFTLAAHDLQAALSKLKDTSDFNDGKSFMNMELIYSGNANVINYDRDVIQFHGMAHTDGNGNIIDSDAKLAPKIAAAIKAVEANIQKTFTIIPPQILKIAKDVQFDEKVRYFTKKIDALRDTYNLSDTDEVKMYHENWWLNQIDNNFPGLTADVKNGLLLRWAYSDKKTLDMRAIAKLVDANQLKAIKEFDKISDKKWKENIMPFENIFLELGAVVLKNVSNFVAANPEAEKQRLHQQIKSEAEKIKLNGDLSQIDKVEKELNRLQSIGGIESIIPTEGIVFKLNGKLFKLTGTFAAINQLIGIIKYAR